MIKHLNRGATSATGYRGYHLSREILEKMINLIQNNPQELVKEISNALIERGEDSRAKHLRKKKNG